MIKKKINSLTSRQTLNISLVISGLFFICCFLKIRILNLAGDELIYRIILILGGTISIFILFYIFIFKGIEKNFNEESIDIKEEILKKLPKNDFKEVYYVSQLNGSERDMILEILNNINCKFYAKVLKNENICVTVTDNESKQIYTVEIENYRYFKRIFSLNKITYQKK